MSGGVVQLVATGAQDAWLTGKPEISFYRSNYKRYTHYANSVERQIIQGQPSAGGISTIRFEKKGDLMNYTYLTARDSNGSSIYNLDWSKVIDKVELLIGGQVIDTQDFEYSTDIEPVTGAQTFSNRFLNNNPSGPTNQKNVFYPFKFFFCKDWSVSLPLVALQYHDVEIRITWSANLGQNITFGPTTQPALSTFPQATGNVLSVGNGSVVGANTANVVFQQSTGPLFPGSLVVGPLSNLQTNVAVIQATSNSLSNAVVAFANTATANIITGTFGSGASFVANIYAPVTAAQVPLAATIPLGATSASLTFNSFASPTSGVGVSLGQYVAGLPVTGPAYVTGVSNLASGNVTVSFPATTSATTVTAGTTVGFFQGAATSSQTYSGLQFQCWTNFVYLDQTERDYFAKTPQDLLITQVNRVTLLNNPVQEIALAQPVKFLAFPSVNYSSIWANGSNSLNALNYQLKTQVNGVDVGEFRFMPQWVDLPQYYNTPFGYGHNNGVANVAIISYCLDTSKLQPTGTLNFSRIDTFRLVAPPTLPNGILGLSNSGINYPVQYLYAVNYNVLRIQNGLGGILYAN
jgi:Major capsid protein N-terminus/Large eukaryotic DNA virus major capsid protein